MTPLRAAVRPDGRPCVLAAAVRPTASPARGELRQTSSRRSSESFLCLFVPLLLSLAEENLYYFGLSNGECAMSTRGVHSILFLLFLWWLHYSLTPEFLPKLFFSLSLSSVSSSLAPPSIISAAWESAWAMAGSLTQRSECLSDFWSPQTSNY